MDQDPLDPTLALRSFAWTLLWLAIVATAALVTVIILTPRALPLALQAYLLLLAALSLWLLVRVMSGSYRPATDERFQEALAPPAVPPLQPEELLELGRVIRFSTRSATDLHFRLRPILREVAAHRLYTRRDIALDDTPAKARAVLGDEAWELLRCDRPSPADRQARGADRALLAKIIRAIEEI